MRAVIPVLVILIGGISSASLAQHTPDPALLVGEKSGALLAIVDPVALTIVARVDANPHPHEVATDGKYAYISNSRAQSITVIDLENQKQVAGIPLHPLGVVHGLMIVDGKLYYAHESTRTITRYDLETKNVDWVLGTGIPRAHMMAVSKDANALFVTSMSAGEAVVIDRDPETGKEWNIHRFKTGPRAEGLDISPDGKQLWVNNVNNSTISVIDVEEKRLVDTFSIPTSFSNRLKFTLDGRYVFVADLRGTDVLVFNAETRQIEKKIPVGGGTEGILMSPNGDNVFVAVSTAGKVVSIDLDSLTVVGEVTGLNNPDGMAWAEK